MATTGSGHMPNSFALRSGLPTFGNFGNALLERSNPGLRKSTPDSEALASSDEEVEHSRLRSAAQRKAQSNRRSSLLADQSQDFRRLSFAGNNTYSPATGSQPNTPGGTTDNWSTISPSLGTWNTGTAYPFGANIWGTKEANPSRLSEGQRQDNSERLNTSVSSHPNASVHRSLSFSVGQNGHEAASSMTPTAIDNSCRPSQYLTRRSSRQSNLASEASGLERVNEIEHDPAGSSFTQPRMQSRTMSNASTYNTSAVFRTTGLRNSVHERSELAIDDVDEPVVQSRVPIRNAPSRRLSDIQTITSSRGSVAPPFSTSNFLRGSRDNLHWSSGVDLGHLETIPASRRHSFADVPTRRGSLGSTGTTSISYIYNFGARMLTAVKEDDIPSPSYDTTANMLSQDQDGKSESKPSPSPYLTAA
ncbi:hypothetical protein H2198_006078 [Neophaeococcomyces mojaviensis]|uniref:Uncharacterized protein n=1 Tax=Neophaeococcomyces mojaviensis TaxID=3383035 RepID=A0ACC3A496_9EURO|nr:hypothetical protein H2198_006078 [Knufia sp. JES_112]